jgi:hypothetical protein
LRRCTFQRFALFLCCKSGTCERQWTPFSIKMWDSVSELLQNPFVRNDLPGYHVLLAAGSIAAVGLAYYVLNCTFCLLDTPVASHAPSGISSSSDITGFGGAMKDFPWKTPPKRSQESGWNIIRTLLKLPPTSWIVVIFDWEGRRQRKWDTERLRWRDLQQQLSILRAVRAQRTAAHPDPRVVVRAENKGATTPSVDTSNVAPRVYPWQQVDKTNW